MSLYKLASILDQVRSVKKESNIVLAGTMREKISRRRFLTESLAAGAVLPLALQARDKGGPSQRPLVLWYDQPASEWVEALPIGNGRLGAMVFGRTANERLQLNEDTIFAGGPYDSNNPEALQTLPEARRLILEGQYKEA